MLHKVELLIAGGYAKILSIIVKIFLFLLAFLIGEGHAAFFAKARFG